MRSDISGFYKKSIKERVEELKKQTNVDDFKALSKVKKEKLDQMIENVIGGFVLPFGVATNFKVNGKDYLIPMVTEEPSVVAASSKAAKLARKNGGFKAEADEPIMIGQIQLVNLKDLGIAANVVEKEKENLIELANKQDPVLIKFGGGVKKLKTKKIKDMLVVEIYVDVRDAMGANAVNTMCEVLGAKLEKLTNGEVRLRIISNLATERKARARAVWKKEDLGGEKNVDKILDAYELARNDIYRATTHNKGIMNGIDAVALATGNDYRALEAGAHAYASLNGYHPLTKYRKDQNGNLIGEIELPLAVGTVGGATKSHPTAMLAMKILNVDSAQELSKVIASVGLAQNFAALNALAKEGIQKGHMKLHSKNIASQAGAKEDEVEEVSKKMIESGEISENKAKEILEEIRK